MQTEKIKTGVIGVGHLGRAHLRNLADVEGVEVAGFYDIDEHRAREVAEETGQRPYGSLDELLGASDAVCVVTPTGTHFEICTEALGRGIHTFVEKPICSEVDDAYRMTELARGKGAVLQVGHIERFSGAFRALEGFEVQPRFVESHRLMEFQPRNVDVAVVHDLMIHDIDLVLAMSGSKVKDIDASGVSVITDSIDIANARITFESGCVANLTASRISRKAMRKMRIFQKDAYVTLDFLKGATDIFSLGDEGKRGYGTPVGEFGIDEKKRKIFMHSSKPGADNPLLAELKSFTETILTGGTPVVGGKEGAAALEVAQMVLDSINEKPL